MHEVITLKRDEPGIVELKIWNTSKGNLSILITDEEAVEIKEAIAAVVDRGVKCEKVAVSTEQKS